MVDEADSFGKENDELKSIVNGGFEGGRPAIRVNKETLQPEIFDTFGPKVLASIGSLHETIEDRSIIESTHGRRRQKIRQSAFATLIGVRLLSNQKESKSTLWVLQSVQILS
jgi:hypothetical protein